MAPKIYGTDNGPICPCGCTTHVYSVDDTGDSYKRFDVEAKCVACHRRVLWASDSEYEDVVELRQDHVRRAASQQLEVR